MKTNYIELKPDRLDLPLRPCAVGRASSAIFTIGGDIPDDVEDLAVKVEWYDGGEKKEYTAKGTHFPSDGYADEAWRVYFAPSYFPAASDALQYHVLATDSAGNPRWLGTGVLRILENPANGEGVVPSIIPAGSYAYNPATGFYHKLTAETDAFGNVVVSVEQEGVQL